MLVGSYNVLLVVFSLLVAVLASYTALEMTGRVVIAQRAVRGWWLLGGACAMGFGIWSMHFIGMLAFSLPIPLGYDTSITVLSLLVAVLTSLFALWLVTRPTLPHLRLAMGAVLMGFGIAAMHYIGMAAMQMLPGIDYHPGWFTLSIVVAISASWAALWIAFRLRRQERDIRTRLIAAAVMGLAIVGMHYTGMAAARFPEGSVCGAALSMGGGMHMHGLALLVTTVTVAILGVVLLVSLQDKRLEARLLRMHNTSLAASLDDAQTEITLAALHDPLTRLPNRRLLQQRIEQAIEDAERSASRFALMFMDLDGFKQVNDVYGHQFGDALLVAVADRTRQMLRTHDTLARLGGDEFVMLVRLDGEEDAASVAGRIIHAIARDLTVDGHRVEVTASIGIATCPDHAASERQLMAYADTAMYQAKDAGRNTYVEYAGWMSDSAQEQFQLLADLRTAIDGQQMVLHYQPKLSVASQRISGAEALVRWRHPQMGMVPPDRFIRLAERSGLIIPLGRWVLDEACRQLHQWHDAGHVDWKMSVNLSPTQFTSPQLVDDVRDALRTHQVEPRRLILEITENTVMRDTEVSLRLLQGLAALGVGISIDDFGTGYSSLLYLKRMPATEIKIDHAFVRDLENSSEDVVIVSAIVALGHALDMNIVAEGVETSGQRAYLERLGCDFLQGFLLGRAVDAERFMQLHGQQRPRIELGAVDGYASPHARGH